VRSLIYLGLAATYQQLEDDARAVEAYRMIIRHGRAAGGVVSEMLGLSGLGLLALQQGRLHMAFELASQGVQRMEQSGALPPISTSIYGELGEVCYRWHQMEEARRHFQRAIQVSTLSGYRDAELYYGVILSRLSLAEGDLAAAAREIQKSTDLMQRVTAAAVQEEVVAQQVRVYLAQERPAAAETALAGQGFADLAPDAAFSYPQALLYNSALRILLYRARTRGDGASLARGIALAGRLMESALGRQYLPVALETLLLRAQMRALQGEDARQDYVRALALAEPERYISVFVEAGAAVAAALGELDPDQLGDVRPDFVREVLAAFPAAAPEAPALVEPLTDRELDVLRLMAKGLKYQQIAERLFISLNTVRTHVKGIYGKLEVNNRTQAIDRAQQLEIL
jgi:LuxR family maltose regulon positive regulatory protein